MYESKKLNEVKFTIVPPGEALPSSELIGGILNSVHDESGLDWSARQILYQEE